MEVLLRFRGCKAVFYGACGVKLKENAQVIHTILSKNKNYIKTGELLTLPAELNYGSSDGYIVRIASNSVS